MISIISLLKDYQLSNEFPLLEWREFCINCLFYGIILLKRAYLIQVIFLSKF